MTHHEGDNVAETGENERWELKLYIAGQTSKSEKAIANLRHICEEHLEGRYSIEIVDLLENPEVAKDDQIVAIPTLIRQLPPPLKKIIGDLSKSDRVLVGLEIKPKTGTGLP